MMFFFLNSPLAKPRQSGKWFLVVRLDRSHLSVSVLVLTRNNRLSLITQYSYTPLHYIHMKTLFCTFVILFFNSLAMDRTCKA